MSNGVLFFGPRKVEELALITEEIAQEKMAAGIPIDEKAREFIAACVVSCAANGEYDPDKIRKEALSYAA